MEGVTFLVSFLSVCVMLCETLMTASRFPELTGFTTYYRNRKSRAAGGVAIMIRDDIARYAVDVGRLEN